MLPEIKDIEEKSNSSNRAETRKTMNGESSAKGIKTEQNNRYNLRQISQHDSQHISTTTSKLTQPKLEEHISDTSGRYIGTQVA